MTEIVVSSVMFSHFSDLVGCDLAHICLILNISHLLLVQGAEAGQPGLQDVEMLTLSSDATALMPSPQWLQLLQSGTAQVGEQVTVDHPGR